MKCRNFCGSTCSSRSYVRFAGETRMDFERSVDRAFNSGRCHYLVTANTTSSSSFSSRALPGRNPPAFHVVKPRIRCTLCLPVLASLLRYSFSPRLQFLSAVNIQLLGVGRAQTGLQRVSLLFQPLPTSQCIVPSSDEW